MCNIIFLGSIIEISEYEETSSGTTTCNTVSFLTAAAVLHPSTQSAPSLLLLCRSAIQRTRYETQTVTVI